MDDIHDDKAPQHKDAKTVLKSSSSLDETKISPRSSDNSLSLNADTHTVVKTPKRDEAKTVVKSAASSSVKESEPQPSSHVKQDSYTRFTDKRPSNSPNNKGSVQSSDEHAAALTQIREVIRSQDTSRGFAKAKNAVKKALSDKKIVLNKRFVLEETLGAGGMGTVYKARDLRKIEANDANPYIAVKVLNEDFKNHPNAFVTLQREASRTHILSHPNIVTVHDFDRDGDVIYMTMELLEGKSLDVIIRERDGESMPLEEAFSIIKSYCKALQFAHDKNIIHSDFKPGNIFVTDDGCKVLDFGIARLTNTANDEFDAGELGAITPAYASLAMIENEAPDPRDDIYAAAIIAYELLAGVHPYQRKPADEAEAENLKPKRIKGLSSRQWKALRSALIIRRDQRTESINTFVTDLTETKKFPIFKLFSFILLVVVSWFAYQSFFGSDGLTKQISETFSKAEQCFESGDYNCALESAKTVLELSPDHAQAIALLSKTQELFQEQKEIQLLSEGKECLDVQKNLLCAQTKLVMLENIQASEEKITQLSQKIDDFNLQNKITAYYAEAEVCYNAGDFDCALSEADKILALSPEHGEALMLKQKTSEDIALKEKQTDERMKQYRSAIAKGNVCYRQGRYDCAIEYAVKAKAIVASGSEAKSLEQKSNYAKRQRAENIRKASGFTEKAKKCFSQKNYNCAIANAELALEFFSDYKSARKILNDSKAQIEFLKKNISIQ